jgi:glycogen operon protein
MNRPERLATEPGFPLGAHVDEDGVGFGLYSEHAERIELCLFDPASGAETQRVDLSRTRDGIWREHLTGLGEGVHYGYRVHGPWAPEAGHRFNPHKLLLDPYARWISGPVRLEPAHYAYTVAGDGAEPLPDERDSAPVMPRCVVMADPAAVTQLNRPQSDTIIYEAHARGMTMRHEGLPIDVRGTFAGLSDQRIIDYLKALGINALELMPVQAFIDEPHLQGRGLANYWGYNTIGFFAPAGRYSSQPHPAEFSELVRRLHDAGIEVILDVVYNHSGEGDHLGPSLCFRGIDNASYYRLQADDPRYYVNDTGCGNTLNLAHPQVRALVLDSLRFWAGTMGVDSFRFDLAPALARDGEAGAYNPDSDFFRELAADPLLGKLRLVAEPWDVGPDGYRLGQFPHGWSEWNDRYRDTLRRFWRGDEGLLPDLARALHGSGDLFEDAGRGPASSINFVTSHDGFTLTDLVSHAHKHNEANGEDNRDGHNHNFSDNYGVEGPTEDPRVLGLRLRQRRNLMASLLLSQGTPMLLMGDELGRSQGGNNNAYCQDNETSWFDWSALESGETGFLEFVRYLVSLRRSYPLLNWPEYIHDTGDDEAVQCRWYDRDGQAMVPASWENQHQAWLGKLLSAPGEHSLLLLLNASAQNVPFQLPEAAPGAGRWRVLVDTANRDYAGGGVEHLPGGHLLLRQRSLNFLTYSHVFNPPLSN